MMTSISSAVRAVPYVTACTLLAVVGCAAPSDQVDSPPDLGNESQEDLGQEEDRGEEATPLPGPLGRLSGHLVTGEQRREVSAIFTQGAQGSTGAIVVPLEQDDVLAMALTADANSELVDEATIAYSVQATCPSGEGAVCAELSELWATARVTASYGEAGRFVLRLPEEAGGGARVELRAPAQQFEPHDGFRPHPVPDDPWPPLLESRPEERVFAGRWTGHLLSLTSTFTPSDALQGAACVLTIQPSLDDPYGVKWPSLECSKHSEFGSLDYLDALNMYDVQDFEGALDRSSMRFSASHEDAFTWSFEGQVWSEVLTSAGSSEAQRHRLYHFDGVVSQGGEVIGAFSFVSWGMSP